jgi:hypothetical protein
MNQQILNQPANYNNITEPLLNKEPEQAPQNKSKDSNACKYVAFFAVVIAIVVTVILFANKNSYDYYDPYDHEI